LLQPVKLEMIAGEADGTSYEYLMHDLISATQHVQEVISDEARGAG
jgi:hypothetical protein